jgi:hypothetical protein
LNTSEETKKKPKNKQNKQNEKAMNRSWWVMGLVVAMTVSLASGKVSTAVDCDVVVQGGSTAGLAAASKTEKKGKKKLFYLLKLGEKKKKSDCGLDGREDLPR